MGVRANAGPEADAACPEARYTTGDGPQADGNVETLGVAILGDIPLLAYKSSPVSVT